jgi:transposase InsO family protein
MKDNRLHYPIKLMARVLDVSRAGYYAWLARGPSQRALADAMLKDKIKKAHEDSRETCGPNRIQSELAAEGTEVGRDHIGRLRKELGLRCKQKRKFKATTNSKHKLPTVPNLLHQEFAPAAPGMVWGTDITYIPTDEGWLFLAGVKDFGSKEIVGWAMGDRMTKELVQAALAKALAFRTPLPGCIHHSDRGSQYCSQEYRRDVEAAGFRPSMSRKGNCYDNAPTEILWGCLKQELVHHRHFATRAEAMAGIQEYIEIFYNRARRHSAIGNVAPSRYAESFYLEKSA